VKNLKVFERIAFALEKIADSLNKDKINKYPLGEPLDNMLDENKVKIPIDAIEKYLLTQNVNIKNIPTGEEIERFLLTHNVSIKNIPPEEEADEILDKISIFMGYRYSLIKPFYKQIKYNMNSGGTITIDLKNKTQEEISAICQLASWLHEIAFLEEYNYLKSPRFLLFAKPNRIPKALNFFSGKWLERFVKLQVISLLQQVNPNLKFSYLLNPQIKLPNGDDFELDSLFAIENEIYWFETKTGKKKQKYIQKYSKVSQILKLRMNSCFIILTDITPSVADDLKKMFSLNVVPIEKFSEEFLKSIKKYRTTNIKNPYDSEQNTVA